MRWVWRELHWSGAPLEGDLSGVLRRLAADDHHGPLVFEARVEAGQVRYLLGGAESSVSGAVNLFEDLVAAVALTTPAKPRQPVDRAGRLRIKQPDLPLGLDPSGQALRALLAALGMAKLPKEVAVLQVVLGAGVPPRGAGARPQDPNLTLFDLALYGTRPAGTDIAKQIKEKVGQYRFRAVARIGVAAEDGRRQQIVFGLLAAFRQLQTSSAKIELLQIKPEQVDEAIVPPRKPLRLTAGEALALLAWPVGERELPGLPSRHPVLIAPPSSYRPPSERIFAASTAPGSSQQIGVGIRDALRHTHLMGPTGVGKSTVLLHLIAADIAAGRSVVVIDPKRDLGVDVLSLIPESRRGDVVLLDPSQPDPVGLNPLADVRGQGPLVADGLLSIFKGLFPSMFGPRTSDALHAALLTLSSTKGSTLADLPRLFTDVAFRRRLTAKIDDPLGVGGFWAQYEAMSAGQQAAVVGPVLTRLRQFLLRTGVTAVIDQPAPRFRLDELFTSPRIFIVTLNKGLLGPEASALIGSIVVSQLWQQTLARAARPKDDRVPVSVYIDEAQTFLHLADLAEALEQSRSLGVAWHLAHQHRTQMPGPLMAAIDSNTRSKILFTVDPSDAGAVTKHSRLTPEDVSALPPYEIYANLEHHGDRTGWMSARTLPPPEAISDPTIVAAESRARYGRPPADTYVPTAAEDPSAGARNHEVIVTTSVVTATEIDDEPIGRRRKAAP